MNEPVNEQLVYQGGAALRFLSGDGYAGEASVRCPHCGSDYTHVREVGTLVGCDRHEARRAYTGTVPIGTTGYRRSAVAIVFNCENCPQPFALVIQQHKGVNLVEIHAGLPETGGDGGQWWPPDEG